TGALAIAEPFADPPARRSLAWGRRKKNHPAAPQMATSRKMRIKSGAMLRVGTGGMRAGSVCSAATARMPDDMIGSSEPEGLSIGTGDGVREIACGIGGGIVEPDEGCDSGGGVGVPTRT